MESGMEKYSIEELKLLYRVLHRQLTRHTELLDSHFFHDLQVHLQKQATRDGVDVGDHGAWDAWLGNEAPGCAERVQKRRVIR
jgi:hypothetical protein